jgi:hypothetical protein
MRVGVDMSGQPWISMTGAPSAGPVISYEISRTPVRATAIA